MKPYFPAGVSSFQSFVGALRHSTIARLGVAMSLLATLSIFSVLISTVIAESSSGKASAINLSGSLRMTSFRLLSEIQQVEKRQQASNTIAQFDRRLETLEKSLLGVSDPLLQKTLTEIRNQWVESIRPAAKNAIDEMPTHTDKIQQLAQEIPPFVSKIDEVVYLIEIDLEERIDLLSATQVVLLAMMILVSFVTVWMLRRELIKPLYDLVKAAQSVTAGTFSTRVQHTDVDELGQLGQAFNTMMDEIATMYGHLEDKVAEKTLALSRTNQSLELLYQTSQRLSTGNLSLEVIQEVMRDIEVALELGHNAICISEHGQLPAQQVVGDMSIHETRSLRAERQCADCFKQACLSPEQQVANLPCNGQRMIVFPLGVGEHFRGVMPVMLREQQTLSREKLRILETVSRHISNALTHMHRTEERHRLAVLEERAVIARELHDSIAQSLSYLKIQVTRLEKQLSQDHTATPIADELKTGLNAAYRELRELITTFRLRVDERGFSAALQETIEEFSHKLGFEIAVDNRLSGILLSGNEEMHVIRIIREGLANIEKHAQASVACITIDTDEQRMVQVCIRDNGVGFNPANAPHNHYGLIIMRDRAHILGGVIDVNTANEGGTEICLRFTPEQFNHPNH